jgi:hypothetical protein
VVKAVSKGEADFANIAKAASIVPEKAQIILSMPHFTVKFRIKSYILACGVNQKEVPVWVSYLNSGNREAIEFMQETALFARIIGISVIQKTKMNENFVRALRNCRPQCDVAYLMCRSDEDRFLPIVETWATQNAYIFIDLITMCKARGLPMPAIVPPSMNSAQQEIFRACRDAKL